MMNAEVTAENRPAYGPSQQEFTRTPSTTYKYQRCVQIFVVFLHELSIVLLGFISVMVVELSANIFLVRWQVLTSTSWGYRE